MTEEHSIRWKFCLVYQKRFHLSWSASENELVRTHKDRTQETAEIEPTCFRGGEFELHPRFHVKYLACRAIMGDAVLEDFRGKVCAFVANWLRGKGLNKLCAVFEVFKF